MHIDIMLWAGAALLLLLSLPFSGTRKLVLEFTAWALRLAIIASLIGGAILWFRPDLLPAEVVTVANASPEVRAILPSPESRTFGLAAGMLVAAVLTPCLAMTDVTRKLAGRRLRRLRAMTDPIALPAEAPVATVAVVETVPAAASAPAPVQRRSDRRSAAETMAGVGSRKPYRVADHLS